VNYPRYSSHTWKFLKVGALQILSLKISIELTFENFLKDAEEDAKGQSSGKIFSKVSSVVIFGNDI